MNTLLENSTMITEKEMIKAIKSRTPAEYNAAKNMYVDLWRSMTSKSKRALAGLCSKICNNGSAFLFYLMQYYAGTAPQIV